PSVQTATRAMFPPGNRIRSARHVPRGALRLSMRMSPSYRPLMKLGLVVPNMGPASSRDLVTAAAQAADACPAIDDVWVVDHVAIPPDQSEGSGGRSPAPLATPARPS